MDMYALYEACKHFWTHIRMHSPDLHASDARLLMDSIKADMNIGLQLRGHMQWVFKGRLDNEIDMIVRRAL
jgi:hypothetical protein